MYGTFFVLQSTKCLYYVEKSSLNIFKMSSFVLTEQKSNGFDRWL